RTSPSHRCTPFPYTTLFRSIAAKPEIARTITWWIDSGDVDPWRVQAQAISQELTRLGIANDWQPYTGDHSAAYWSARVGDYLELDRKSTRLNSSHQIISYAV